MDLPQKPTGEQIKKHVQEALDQREKDNQMGYSPIAYHTHNGTDSPAVVTVFPVTTSNPTTTVLQDGSLQFGNQTPMSLWARINKTWVRFISLTGATSGTVLTGNGSGNEPTFQNPSITESIVPVVLDGVTSTTSIRLAINNTGGTTTFDNNGMTISTGAGAGNHVDNLYYIGATGTDVFCSGMQVSIRLKWQTAVTNKSQMFIGLGNLTDDGTTIDFTQPHAGFKVIGNGTISVLSATQAVSGVESATTLFNLTALDVLDLIFKNNGSSVSYWTRKNGGALSLPTTISSNFPDGTLMQQVGFQINNNNTANTVTINSWGGVWRA